MRKGEGEKFTKSKVIISLSVDGYKQKGKNSVPSHLCGRDQEKLSRRLDKHKRAVRMTDSNASAIVEAAWSAGHTVDWNGVTVLDQPYTPR